jgi:long-chain acyl-CoA synthetase
MTTVSLNKTVAVTTNRIAAAEAATLPGLLLRRVERTPDLPAYHQNDRDQDRWVTWKWRQIGREVARWRQALAKEALVPGDRVAILLANSVEWIFFEQAALGLGLVVVPLYTWDSPENLAYLLRDSGCRLLLTGSMDQWLQLAPLHVRFPELSRVLCLEHHALPPATGGLGELGAKLRVGPPQSRIACGRFRPGSRAPHPGGTIAGLSRPCPNPVSGAVA